MPDGFGKYEVYAVAGSRYCYKDSNVLRNNLGIMDHKLLRRVEADLSMARQTELMENPVPGHFTVNHLCEIHRWLLGDLYTFAGHFRYEDIAKGETQFLAHGEIKAKLTKLLFGLCKENYFLGLDWEHLVDRSAYYFAELNYIHPFREGNGRATREFMRLLFLKNGYKVDWSIVPVEELIQSMIDSVYDTSNLKQVLNKCLGKIND